MLAWLGRLWSAPVTLVGVLLMLPYGVRFVRVRDGSLHIGVRRMLGAKGVVGQTFGEVILTKPEADDARRLWFHELVHRDQCRALGVLVLVGYPLFLLSTAMMPGARYYRDHPFECQAQKLARVKEKKADALASADRS